MHCLDSCDSLSQVIEIRKKVGIARFLDTRIYNLLKIYIVAFKKTYLDLLFNI